MATTRVFGRSVWASGQAASNPVCDLLIGMIKRARRDIEIVDQIGDRVTPAQQALRESAKQFIQECKQEFGGMT